MYLKVNDATHYIDGSQIYGSDNYTASTLRSYTGGTLKSVLGANSLQEFCPYSSDPGKTPDVTRTRCTSCDTYLTAMA